MSSIPGLVTSCQLCTEALNDEEVRSPETSGGWVMCDVCYSSPEWSHVCGLCDETESNDIHTFAVVVGDRAGEAGLVPGVFQVLRWPWLSSNMFSQHAFSRSLLRVADAPDHIDGGGEVLCRECAAKAIVRRTYSGRWRVTTVRRWRGWWRSKTRVYRTRELATRRAKAHLYAN